MSARDLVGDEDEFLFLASDEVVVRSHTPRAVWDAIEDDRHDALLTTLSPRYVGRHVLEELPDGYRCATSSRAPLRRTRSYESVVWLEPPGRSVEIQFGRRTDLRYELSYEAVDGGTRVTCTQWFRGHTAGFGSGPAGRGRLTALTAVTERGTDRADRR